MANLTFSNVAHDSTGQIEYITASLVISGTYVQSAGAGEPFDPSTLPGISQWYKAAPKLPLYVAFMSTNGYALAFLPGTTLATGKLRICTASNTELGAGAYPAGITGDTGITVEIACRKA